MLLGFPEMDTEGEAVLHLDSTDENVGGSGVGVLMSGLGESEKYGVGVIEGVIEVLSLYVEP